MKKDILLLYARPGYNENQTWLVYLPYNYSEIYSHTDKFNGLKLFNFEKRFAIRVDKPILNRLDVKDFLQKCTVEYDLINSGSFNEMYDFKKITIGNKIIEL